MKRSHLLVAGAAILAAPALPVRAQTAATIRFGAVPVEEAALAFYAKEKGFFKAAGLDVELTILPNGGSVTQAILGGALDVGVTNSGSMSSAHARGVPIYLVACGALYSEASPIAHLSVGKTTGIKTAKDLSGKTLAVSTLRDMIQATALSWIDKNGGDSKTVRFVELPFPAMPEALHAKRVDAAVIAEPALSVARPNSRVLAPVYSAISPAFPIDAWTAPSAWVNANRDAARRFATAMHDACAWANANHDKSADITASFMKLDATVIRSRTRALFAEARGFDAAAQPLLDAGVAYGVLKPTHARDLIAPGVSI